MIAAVQWIKSVWKKRKWIFFIVIALLILGGGYWAYAGMIRPNQIMRQADALVAQGLYEKALAIYRELGWDYPHRKDIPEKIAKVRQLDSEAKARVKASAEALYAEGEHQMDLMNYDEAVAAFQQAVELCPNDKNYQVSLKEARQKRQNKLDSIELYGQGMEAVAVQDWVTATQCFQSAIRLYPYDSSYYYQNGLAFVGRDLINQAVLNFKRALELTPSLELCREAAGICMEAEHYYEAAYFYALAATYEQLPEDYYNAALAYYMNEEYEKALEYYDQALELDPDNAQYLEGRNAAQDALYRESLPESTPDPYDPDDPYSNVYYARSLIEEYQYSEAISYYDKAIALDPSVSWFYVEKGKVLTWLARYEEALACFDQGIALAPDSPDGYFGKGDAYLWSGRYAEALACYNRVAELDPEYTDIQYRIRFTRSMIE